MYDFKYKIDEKRRLNSYQIDIPKKRSPLLSYKTIRNTLLIISLLLSIFLLGALTFKHYQKNIYRLHSTQKNYQEKIEGTPYALQ
jgi:hypothetical protein